MTTDKPPPTAASSDHETSPGFPTRKALAVASLAVIVALDQITKQMVRAGIALLRRRSR